MPTYKNVSSRQQSINNKVVEPGQVACSLNYIDENATGLLKVDDAPFYNPVLLSKEITSEGTVEIPKIDNLGKPVEKYALHFYVASGKVDIYYNSLNNRPPLNLYETAKWNVRMFNRYVEKIFVQSKDPFSLTIIIEKLNGTD